MVGCTRSEISVLTESTQSPQEPRAPSSLTLLVSFPFLPILFPAFSNSTVILSFISMMSLSVSQMVFFKPNCPSGMRTEKFPFRTFLIILIISASVKIISVTIACVPFLEECTALALCTPFVLGCCPLCLSCPLLGFKRTSFNFCFTVFVFI